MKLRHNRGFTLLELFMVLGVIGILSMIALPSYQAYVYRAKAAEVILVLDKIRTVLTENQSERGASLGTGLKVFTTARQAVSSFVVSQGLRSMMPIPDIAGSELSYPELGLELSVISGYYNTNSPGQYKVSISWIPPLPGREEQSRRSRQIALAIYDVMKPHTYLATVGSTETTLYFSTLSITAGQAGTVNPTKPNVITPSQSVITPQQPVLPPPQPMVQQPQPVVTPAKPPVTGQPQQPITSQSSNSGQPSVTTQQQPPTTTPSGTPSRPTSTSSSGGSSQYDPGWYMNPLTPTPSQTSGTSSTSDPFWYMDPQAKPPANTPAYDPLWYMDPNAKPPGTTTNYDPFWYMDPLNRNWVVTP